MKPRKKNPLAAFLGALFRQTLAISFGLSLTFLVFFALPFMEIVASLGQKKMTVRTVEVAAPPPPPIIEEEKPPEEPPPEEKPPEPAPQEQISLADLELSLNPGGVGDGTGASIASALAGAAANAANQLFSGSGGDIKPRPTVQVPPKYPAALRKQKLEGVVIVSFVVDQNGRVISPKVEQTPHPAFAKEALDAIKQWKFEPGQRGGTKVPMKMKVPIRFSAK